MAVDERRLEYVERVVEEHRQNFADVKDAFRHLETKMDDRFARLDDRFERLETRVEARFEKVDERFVRLEAKVESLDSKYESKFDAVLSKMDSQFRWLIGIQFGVLVTVIGVLLAR